MSFPGKPTIFNVSLTSASTEYSQTLPEYASKVMVKCRTSFPIQFSWTSGQSGILFMTVPADQTYWDDQVGMSQTIYLQSSQPGVVAEIQTWSGA